MIAAGKRIVAWKPGQPVRLYPIFDAHVGNPGCAEEAFRRYVQRIADDPHALWCLGGDGIDAIGYRDKRFNPRTVPPWLRVQDLASLGGVLLDYLEALFKPIAAKCWGLAWGNHEDAMLRDTQSWERWGNFCDAIGAPNLEVGGFRDLVFREKRGVDHSFRVLVYHGGGAAATSGGKINRVDKTLVDFPRADLVFIGHLHDQIDHRKTGIDADEACERIVDFTRLGVMCGTWLRTYTAGPPGYGEVRGYSPTPLGNPVIELDPATREAAVRWPKC